MNADTHPSGQLIHIVTLECRDADHARRCLGALAEHGRPDALALGCESYEFGLVVGTDDSVRIVERWRRWQDLDALIETKVVPALPNYNQLLKRAFDPAVDTLRVELTAVTS